MDMAQNKTREGKLKKTLIAATGGGLFGFLGAMGFLKLADGGMLGRLGPSEEIAGLIGILYIITGLAVGVGVLSPGFGARFLNVEDAEELIEQRRMLGYSTVGMLALGLALVAAALSAPAGPIAGGTVLAIFLAMMVVASFVGWQQRRFTDEMVSSVSREATSLAFYLLFLIGGAWALLAHTGFAPAPAPLDWLTGFAVLLLLACFIVAGKRGMLAMR